MTNSITMSIRHNETLPSHPFHSRNELLDRKATSSQMDFSEGLATPSEIELSVIKPQSLPESLPVQKKTPIIIKHKDLKDHPSFAALPILGNLRSDVTPKAWKAVIITRELHEATKAEIKRKQWEASCCGRLSPYRKSLGFLALLVGSIATLIILQTKDIV